MKRRLLLPLILALAAVAGCTSTRVSRIETGMFDNKPETMLGVYATLENRTSNDRALTKQEFEAMGFNLKAPNVEDIPGPLVMKRLFGERAFERRDGTKRAAESLEEFSDYRGFLIPYRNIVTISDRVYFSETETFRKGEYIRIFVIFHGDTLCYHELAHSKPDTYYSRYAFAEALFFAIKAPGRAALSILETLNEYQNPGLEFVAPIPIPP